MQSFRHISGPLRLFAGEKSLDRLDRELARLGCDHAAILCGQSIARHAGLDLVRAGAGHRYVGTCDRVRPHSPRHAVEEVAEGLKKLGADAIIAIGGGSAMVTARAAAILLAENKPLDELCTRRDANGDMHSPRLDAPKIPIFAIPTTPATAVVKAGTAVFDQNSASRLALFDPKTRPQAIFLEPALLASAPDGLVRNAAINTLVAGVEGLVSRSPDPISQGLLIHAVRLTAAELLRPDQDGAQRRSNLTMAAIMCGRGTDNTGMGLATVISHAIAKRFDVDGGVAKAVALPHVLRFNRDYIQKDLGSLSLALGSEDSDAASATAELFRDLGLPERLRDLGISKDNFQDIASNCMEDWFIRSNPRPVTEEADIVSLLEEAW